MFKRLSAVTEDLVVEAQNHALRLEDDRIGTEHFLLALLTTPSPVNGVLNDLGVTVEVVERDRAAFLRATVPAASEGDALAALGIDLEQVEAATDAAFGVGALGKARRSRIRPRRWRPRSRRADPEGSDGRLPFSSRSKNVLELSLKEALRLKHKRIGPEHVALGMLNEGEGLACRILLRNGVTLEGLRVSLEELLTRAA